MTPGGLADHLAHRDVPCPECGYNLRGLSTDRCPECDSELVLCVRLAEPRHGAWITSLCATAVMLGFHGIMGAYVAYTILRNGRWGPDLRLGVTMWVCTAVALGMLGALLLARRPFRRAPDYVRTGLATGACLIAALSFIIFFSLV